MAPPESFSRSRLVWARRRRGFTQVELAAAIGTDVRSIKGYEAGAFAPQPDRLRAIALRLEFPARFFFGQDIGDLAPERASFRLPSTMPAGLRSMVLGGAALAIAIDQWIASRYALPEMNLPDPRATADADTEAAAEALRRRWDLGNVPIDNVIRLIEAKGIRIYSLPPDAIAAGAFSLWHADRPYMFLDPFTSPNHLRLDAARELGHLLLHRRTAAVGRKAEQDAIAFARAFLIPAPSRQADPASFLSLDGIATGSKSWGVPPHALAHRLHELGQLSEWQYRKLNIGDADDVRQHEGGLAHGLAPEILQAVFAALRAHGITRHTLARELHLYLKDVDDLTFGQGSALLNDVAGPERKFPRLRPRLAVVRS